MREIFKISHKALSGLVRLTNTSPVKRTGLYKVVDYRDVYISKDDKGVRQLHIDNCSPLKIGEKIYARSEVGGKSELLGKLVDFEFNIDLCVYTLIFDLDG